MIMSKPLLSYSVCKVSHPPFILTQSHFLSYCPNEIIMVAKVAASLQPRNQITGHVNHKLPESTVILDLASQPKRKLRLLRLFSWTESRTTHKEKSFGISLKKNILDHGSPKLNFAHSHFGKQSIDQLPVKDEIMRLSVNLFPLSFEILLFPPLIIQVRSGAS